MIGLPSLQTMDRAQVARIWLAAEATDMRCGFDRLAQRVQTVIGEDPLNGHLFIFRSSGGNRLKMHAVSWRWRVRHIATRAIRSSGSSYACASGRSPRPGCATATV